MSASLVVGNEFYHDLIYEWKYFVKYQHSIITLLMVFQTISGGHAKDLFPLEEKVISLGIHLNIRQKPSITSRIVGRMNIGDIAHVISKNYLPVTIGNKSDYWYHINFHGISGYVFGYYIQEYKAETRIVVSNKLGRIIFLNDTGKVVSYRIFEAYAKKEEEYLKKKKQKLKNIPSYYSAQHVKRLSSNYFLLDTISGHFNSEYRIFGRTLFNSSGHTVYVDKGDSRFTVIDNSDFIMVKKSVFNNRDDSKYLRQVDIIDAHNGRKPRVYRIKQRWSTGPGEKEQVFSLRHKEYFVAAINSNFISINLKSRRVKRFTIAFNKKSSVYFLYSYVRSIEYRKGNFYIEILVAHKADQYDLDRHVVQFNPITGRVVYR